MPDPAWKLSAAIAGDWLYLYGGNKGGFRDLSSADQLGDVWRINFNNPGEWEKVISGIKLESLSMLAYKDAIYTIGGLTIWNQKGDSPDQHSTNQVWKHDPKAQTWKELTPLPEPRSAHGSVIVDGKIYIIGGQNIQGNARRGAAMQKIAYRADLSTTALEWQQISDPPFYCKDLLPLVLERKYTSLVGQDQDVSISMPFTFMIRSRTLSSTLTIQPEKGASVLRRQLSII